MKTIIVTILVVILLFIVLAGLSALSIAGRDSRNEERFEREAANASSDQSA